MTERRPFEQFFAFRRFLPTLAFTPEAETVYFVTNTSGQFNLWSAPADGGRPQQLTSFTENTVRGVAVRGDGEVLFSADRDGDEFNQLYRIAAGGGWPEQLTDLPAVQHALSGAAWAPDGRSFVFGANRRTPADFEVWVQSADGGEPRSVFGRDRYAVPGAWSPDGSKLIMADVRSNTDLSIFLLEVASGETPELTPHEGQVKFLPGPWLADGSGFYLLSDDGREFTGLARYDFASDGIVWVETPDLDIEELAGS